MQSRNGSFKFGPNFNFGTEAPMVYEDDDDGDATGALGFLLLDTTHFKLLDGTNFLLLGS